MALHTYGTMAVDWEERVRFDRLREERLTRISSLLAESELGALLCFDMTNIRYITATHIGTWAQDKLNRFCLLPQGDEPIMWDFGSAARHHELYNPWLDAGRSRAGISTLRGAMAAESGRAEDVAEKIRAELAERDLLSEPVGIDAVEPPVLFALQAAGVNVVDGQQLLQQARVIKSQDEITLLNTACMMVDAAYEELYREMRPGMRENECVALVNKVLYDMGSEFVEGVNAISGERCNPHPHVYTDRALRPGDPAYFDILHSFMGYRTCYYRTFAVGSASRSEEQLVVTKEGCEVITRFPAEDLLVAGKPYYTAGGSLPLARETQSNLNTSLDRDRQEASPANGRPAGDSGAAALR